MKKTLDNETTHFGFQQIPATEKSKKVADVFHSVATKYDLMNDLMSLGVHRLWKQFTIQLSHIRPGDFVLDLAGGTGDLSAQFVKRVGDKGNVYLADINASMLEQGRERLLDQGIVGNIHYTQADAECLPFSDNTFNCVCIAFGLRNVTHKEKALNSIYRVLKPGGQLLILEFSTPTFPGLQPIYDLYSFNILPLLGKMITNDEASYRYLAESIRMHPDQKTLEKMMETAGFEQCKYNNLTGGIVALHRGYKL